MRHVEGGAVGVAACRASVASMGGAIDWFYHRRPLLSSQRAAC
jgi:hypothetical protein